MTSPYFAAVDLGSNSFHMVVVRSIDDQVEIIDREKDMVQIANGIDNNGKISVEAMERALNCLKRFAERLKDIPREHIRSVGTKTLRSARNSARFLLQAQNALGHSIQIISGYEEARLVYSGLAHTVINDQNQRLVVDIGGGSTECIIGRNLSPLKLESLGMGCVAYTKRFFNEHTPLSVSMDNAYRTASNEIMALRKPYLDLGWDIAYGTSGTVKAIGQLLSHDQSDTTLIHSDAMIELTNNIKLNNHLPENTLPELRKNVLPAGIAILKALFDQLKLSQIHIGDAALKEGLIYDTIGRFSAHDCREDTITTLTKRYNIDEAQGLRVANCAITFWDAIKAFTPDLSGLSRTKVLRWAAYLHEIGLSVSHSDHHKHSHYLVKNSDLAGFGRHEQHVLSTLIRFQRKKIKLSAFNRFTDTDYEACVALTLCLRLAICLNRGREQDDFPLSISKNQKQYRIVAQSNWLNTHPLTYLGLQDEIELLKKFGLDIALTESQDTQ